MNDQPTANETPQEPPSPREMRRRERQERREARRMGGSWIAGAVLILLGIVFLLQNQGIFFLQNWWALFILFPAFGALNDAWRHYQDSGSLNAKARNSVFFGIILILVSLIFLMGWSWTILGPTIIILVGIGILVNALLPGEKA